MTQYDMIIIGGGPAGITAAKYGASFDKKVALIEKAKLGGECTWSGCVASKALLKVAEVAYKAKQFKDFGLKASEDFQLHSESVMDHVRKCINRVYQDEKLEVLKALGIEILIGSPSFIDNHTIILNDQKIYAKKFIIATGSVAAIPHIDGIKNVEYLTNVDFFALKKLPKSIIILGAGPNGIELGSALVRLGVETTIIEHSDVILPHEDQEITKILRQQLEKEGLVIHTGLKAVKVEQAGDSALIHTVDIHDNPFTFQAERLLVACGRTAQVAGLALEKAGVSYSSSGIVVDTKLRTTAKNIFACGDVVGPYRFSHVAMHQGMIAARNALFPIFKKRIDYNQMIWVTFGDPEYAVAGLSEEEARKQYGDSIQIIKIPYSEIDRAKTDLEEIGVAKFILSKWGYILGAAILGRRAGDIIHELQVAKYQGMKLRKLYPILHAYPTYSELIWKAAEISYLQKMKNNIFIKFVRLISRFKNRK